MPSVRSPITGTIGPVILGLFLAYILGFIHGVLGALIAAYFIHPNFRNLVDRSARWMWLHIALFWIKKWPWLLFVAIGALAVSVYLSVQAWWVFLLAYALWTSLLLLLKKKTQITSPAVTCLVDGHHDEHSTTGLKLVLWYDDGKVIKDMQGDLLCRRSDNKAGHHYFYFVISDDRKESFRHNTILISVEYFDLDQEAEGPDKGKRGITLKYDAIGDGLDNIFRKAGEILFTSSHSWKVASFSVRDAHFSNRQNGVADFRFACLYPSPKRDYDIYIRRIVVVPIDTPQ